MPTSMEGDAGREEDEEEGEAAAAAAAAAKWRLVCGEALGEARGDAWAEEWEAPPLISSITSKARQMTPWTTSREKRVSRPRTCCRMRSRMHGLLSRDESA